MFNEFPADPDDHTLTSRLEAPKGHHLGEWEAWSTVSVRASSSHCNPSNQSGFARRAKCLPGAGVCSVKGSSTCLQVSEGPVRARKDERYSAYM